MLRFLWSLLQIGLVLLIVAVIGQFNAPVQITWDQYLVELSLQTLAIALVTIVIVLLGIFWAWGKIRGLPLRFQEFRKNRQRDAGYRALTRGMVAVAAGEQFAAQKAAKQAESLLQDPPLTMLLSAQSAQLGGDELAASKYFRRMLEHPELAFLGWRGLIMLAVRAGNTDEAQKLIAEAELRFPKQPWLIEQALDFEEKKGNTQKALSLVQRAKRVGALQPLEAVEREVSLYLQQARALMQNALWREALKSVDTAWRMLKKNKNESSFPNDEYAYEIQVFFSELHCKMRQVKKAEDALKKRWQWQFDEGIFPLLDEIYAEGGVSPLQQWRKFKQFFDSLAMSSDGACRLATMAMNAGLSGEAEAMLDRDPEPVNLPHYQLRLLLAEQKKDHEAQEFWRRKALDFREE